MFEGSSTKSFIFYFSVSCICWDKDGDDRGRGRYVMGEFRISNHLRAESPASEGVNANTWRAPEMGGRSSGISLKSCVLP